MDLSWLSRDDIQALRANFTSNENHIEEHFLRCWKRQTCKGCLAISQCSWCPFTWSCVPNTQKIPLLAPAYDENVCPHWAERWELRTRPLGCQVSSITSLTAIVTIISTFVFVLITVLLAMTIRWLWRYHKKNPRWWRLQSHRWASTWRRYGEREPLLPESGGP
ncbi:PSI domain-containing protein [Fusarium acuminatum]|uniref:PSI domain-containing protein n=1 Tax=Fusarium acuminatum TaxID=5515 RepID=A0ABZ2WG40_9HYPO